MTTTQPRRSFTRRLTAPFRVFGHRVPTNTAVTGAACVALVADLGLVAAYLSGSGLALVLLAVFAAVMTIVTIGALIVAALAQ